MARITFSRCMGPPNLLEARKQPLRAVPFWKKGDLMVFVHWWCVSMLWSPLTVLETMASCIIEIPLLSGEKMSAQMHKRYTSGNTSGRREKGSPQFWIMPEKEIKIRWTLCCAEWGGAGKEPVKLEYQKSWGGKSSYNPFMLEAISRGFLLLSLFPYTIVIRHMAGLIS